MTARPQRPDTTSYGAFADAGAAHLCHPSVDLERIKVEQTDVADVTGDESGPAPSVSRRRRLPVKRVRLLPELEQVSDGCADRGRGGPAERRFPFRDLCPHSLLASAKDLADLSAPFAGSSGWQERPGKPDAGSTLRDGRHSGEIRPNWPARLVPN